MVITFDSTYTEAVITSDIIDSWLAINNNTETLTLEVYYNCSDTPTTITLDSDNLESSPNQYTLTPDSLGMGDNFSNGIYFFVLLNEDTLVKETECKFADVDFECQVNLYVMDNITSNIRMLYDALKYLESCADCECDEACTIFEYISNKINSTIINNDCNDC